MADQLLSTGLQIDDALTRLASTSSALRTAISSVLDLSPDQPWGQLVGILNEHKQQLAELLQEIYSGLDPDQATGQSLDALSSITGTYRRPATKGSVDLTLTFTAAGTAPAGALVAVSGDSLNQWELDEAVVAAAAGSYSGSATAVIAGPYPALVGTVTVIVTPAANWTAVTNAAAASAGLDIETDTELRLRREIEVTLGGSSSIDSIRAAVSAIDGVLEVVMFENDSHLALPDLPPHSFEACFWTTATGAALTALRTLIAQAIFDNKSAGIESSRTPTTVTDDGGGTHTIGTRLATARALAAEYTLVTDTDYPGDTAFKAAVKASFDDDMAIGEDVYYTKMISRAFEVPGVVNVTLVRLSLAGGAWVVVDCTIGDRQIATLAVADITVL